MTQQAYRKIAEGLEYALAWARADAATTAALHAEHAGQEPPRQCSADPEHPWHDAYWANYCDVYIDGVPNGRVVTVDCDAGWAEVIGDGFKVGPDGKPEMLTVRGVVELRRKAA